ncbi:hypothetical protein GCM10010411_87780 [Actinomadura fulvescens]|uniref:Uncharacterized protein n=1 Tax=Actinomadura fulvescens TaxID=46160 RepID=A0ABP6D6L1_9ACTN
MTAAASVFRMTVAFGLASGRVVCLVFISMLLSIVANEFVTIEQVLQVKAMGQAPVGTSNERLNRATAIGR